MKNYLVTGGAGFIGSQLAQSLVADGHKVVVVDNLSTGYMKNIPPKAVFIKGDIADPMIIDKLYAHSFEAIFHIAGQSSGEVSFENPIYDLQTNTQSTLLLLKLCRETSCKKFVYASTMSVYGDQKQLPVSEGDIPMPKSFYGVGKLASEHYLRIYANFGIATAALRLFNVYGPGQNMENLKQGMVSIFLAQAINNNHIHVKGAAERFRDFVYIDDVVKAFRKTEISIDAGENLCLNVCSGQKTTVGEVVDNIIHNVNRNITKEFKGSTPGDQFGIYGDNTRIKEQIGWVPQVNFANGLERTVKFLKL